MAIWKPSDGYFSTLLAAISGNAMRRVPGKQDSGGGGGTGAGHAVNSETALKLSAVWACTKLISEAVGAMPINVWSIDKDGTRTLANDHWIYGLLNKPNPLQTRNEFFETLVINLMLAGNSYTRKDIVRAGRVASLVPMMATQTNVKLLKNGARTYSFTESANNTRTFNQDEIWHLPLMPSNGVVGLSPLQYGATTMGIGLAAEERVANLARNGFKSTGVLMIDKVLKPDQRDALRENYSDLQTGQGDPLKILEAGMTYQQIAMSPKDVQLLESRRFTVEDICRFYGVPSVLVNDTTSTTSWGSGISEIKEGFYTLTLQPLLERFESSISKWLLPPVDQGKIAVEFDFSKFLRGNEAQRTTTQAAAVSGNLLTINEARALEGRKSIGPQGDKMYAQQQMVPIGEQVPKPEMNDGVSQPSEDQSVTT